MNAIGELRSNQRCVRSSAHKERCREWPRGSLPSCAEENTQFKVSSIESVKGLDSATCVIILTPNVMKYLLKLDLKAESHFNKEWKKVYVALTRAKQRLVLALDHELLSSSDIEAVKSELERLGFEGHGAHPRFTVTGLA